MELGDHSAFGAVRVAIVPVQPPLPRLRPRRLRDLLARVHDASGDGSAGLSAIGVSALASVILFIPPIHMYRQLRGAYGVTVWGAVWRTSLLLLFAMLVLIGFIFLMVALGVLD